MASKIMWGTVIFVLGFFWFYIGGRQIILNLTVGLPVSRRLAAGGIVNRKSTTPYTIISCAIWLIICGAIFGVLLYFGKTHHFIGFAAGVLLAFFMGCKRLGPGNRENVNNFLLVFARFFPDTELRHLLFNEGAEALRAELEARGTDLRFGKAG